MIRLVASDIDGTLLLNGASAIDPAVFAEIRRLLDKGIWFAPASGRQYSSLRRLFAPVADELPFLCENGAVVFGPGSPGPVIRKTAMDHELALALCQDILEHPRCEVLISGVNTSYLCPKNPDYPCLIQNFVGNNVAILPRPEDIPEDIVKVSACCLDGARVIEPVLAPRWTGHFHAAIAGERWLDFTLADKGTGLRKLCAALDIELSEVMAFGDNYNDLPMLELAGVSYLMSNAAPELVFQIPRHCSRVEEILRTL